MKILKNTKEEYLLKNEDFIKIQDLWIGYKTKPTSTESSIDFSGFYSALKSKIKYCQPDIKLSDYFIKNIDLLPLPYMFSLFYNDIEVTINTNFEEIEKRLNAKLDKLAEKGFSKGKDSLMKMFLYRKENCPDYPIMIFRRIEWKEYDWVKKDFISIFKNAGIGFNLVDKIIINVDKITEYDFEYQGKSL